MSRLAIFIRTLILLAVVCLANGLEARGTKAEPAATVCPSLSVFPQAETITLDWQDNNDKKLEVVSMDGKEYPFKLVLPDLGIQDLKGNILPTSSIIRITPESGRLSNETGTQQIRISLQRTPEIKPGTYSGSLFLTGADPKTNACWVRKQIQLVVPDALPLMDKATFLTYRLVPFTQLWTCHDCLLPLRPTISAGQVPSLKPGTPLAGVKREEGGFGIVSWTGETISSKSGIQQLRMSVVDLDHAGKYDGTLRLNSVGEKTAEVAVTIKASDLFVWPILIIGLGIWLALSVKRYINVKRTIWGLREQEAALGIEYKKSQQRFADASQGFPYAAYSVADDLNEKRRELLDKIDSLKRSAGLAIDETSESYKSLLADLKALEGLIAAWGTFADDLDTLRRELATPAVFGSPLLDSGRPALLASYGGLLAGGPITLAEFADLRKEVSNSIASAREWFSLKSRIDKDVEQLAQLTAKLPQPTDDQKARLSSISQKLVVAKTLLWQAATIEELANLTIMDGTLLLAEQEFYELAAALASAPGPDGGAANAMTASMMSGVATPFIDASRSGQELLGVPTDDTARERFYATAIRRWDMLIALLAFIIAVLTGLDKFYFGQPFGTLKDYVAIFLWAIGTKLTLDAISTAFGWLFSRPSLQANP